MLRSRLWLRALNRRSSQKPRFLSHKETAHSVFSSHRDGFSAGRNLGFGHTRLHDELHLLREGGSCHVHARLCSADSRRCFCTSEVEGNVCSFSSQQDNYIWEKKYAVPERDIPLLHQDFASLHKAAHTSAERCDDSGLYCIGAIADGIDGPPFPHGNNVVACVTRNQKSTSRTRIREDRKWNATATSTSRTRIREDRKWNATATSMRGKDAQNPLPLQSDNVTGECHSFERPEDCDNEDGGVNAWLRLTMESKDSNNAFTPQDNRITKSICKILNSEGWTGSTKEILEKQYSAHLPPAVISAVILRQKNVALASSLFQWACERMGHDIRIYHTYLIRLGETKQFDEMWDLLTKMKENGLEVSAKTFCMMIRACGVAGVPAMAVDAFKKAHQYGIVSDIIHHRALLTMFFESNLLEEARLFYSFMLQEGVAFDTHMFNTLIDGFNGFSATEDAKRSFDTMLKEGHEPHIWTYNGLIKAYCNANAIEEAMSAFSDLQRRGLKPTASTINLLLSMSCKMGRLDDAFSLLSSMSTFCNPNVTTFNILLHGLFSAKKLSKAITIFLSMEKEGLANRLTYVYLSRGLRESPQTERVSELLSNLFAKHGYAIKEVCTALLHNLCCRGKLNEAESLLKGMLESSQELYLPKYSRMIALYCRLEKVDRAFELLSELKGRGERPNVFCYTPIIAALLKVNRVADALTCFQEMLEQKHEVNAIICDFVLRELCKHGMVEDALHVLDTILSKKLCIHKSTFTQLMKCLCKVGKIEEANSCFRALFKVGCLPLKKKAALQALSVMDVMICCSNEK